MLDSVKQIILEKDDKCKMSKHTVKIQQNVLERVQQI